MNFQTQSPGNHLKKFLQQLEIYWSCDSRSLTNNMALVQIHTRTVLYLYYLVTAAVTCVSLTLSPPFVYDSEFNELEDFATLDYPGQGFTTDAVEQMSAKLVEKANQLYRNSKQSKMQDISVSGSLNCLAEFWKFAETIPTLTYEKWIDPKSQRSECDYSITFNSCPIKEELEQDLIVTMNPHALVDGNLSSVWAFPIIEGKNVHIDIDLHSTYAVAALSLQVETVPLGFLLVCQVKMVQ
ncbi:hypothetical protein EB796_009618 [Bugula neritina]|uniref:Uncharacterized protein n=1 Tax=Bugula neritina TaxID=10212 RepID=A0A7J7K3F3_BUGNE|nr:hypothetical protein EB796_009618 [Bugula neritina]